MPILDKALTMANAMDVVKPQSNPIISMIYTHVYAGLFHDCRLDVHHSRKSFTRG